MITIYNASEARYREKMLKLHRLRMEQERLDRINAKVETPISYKALTDLIDQTLKEAETLLRGIRYP